MANAAERLFDSVLSSLGAFESLGPRQNKDLKPALQALRQPEAQH